MPRRETFVYSVEIKAGDPVNVINPSTNKPMGGKWTFRAHVIGPNDAESVEVFGGFPNKEKIRSFSVDRIEPKGR